jgi:ribosomal protein S18 acetylase RimI-like enzyme
MSLPKIVPLQPEVHDRAYFRCGSEALDRYLREQAGQDLRRKACGIWVLVEPAHPAVILGFYTLSPEGVALTDLPVADRKKMPRYPRLGAVLLGRLAVAQGRQGEGIGSQLVMDALHRFLQSEIPAVLMVTDPKDDPARAFYRQFGFEELNRERMFLTRARIAVLLGGAD